MMVRSMCFSPRALVLSAVVGLVFACAGAPAARAGIVVLGNLGSSGTDTANLVNNQSFYLSTTDSAVATSKAYAQGFTTGTTNLSLTAASMYLNTRTVGSGTLTLKLWANSGGVPSGTAVDLASLAVSGTFALRTWSFAPQALSPNTSYWLGFEEFSGQYDGRPVMNPSNNVRINPSVQNASGYSWTSAARISGTGGSWFAVPDSGTHNINLDAGSFTITAVPEPSQIVIALGGLATLGLWRLRRLRRGNGRGRETSASGGLLS